MKKTIRFGKNILRLDKPLLMGILNVTPDSFYKDSRFNPKSEAFLKKAMEMVEQGAHILDIGGLSSRPGSIEISEQEEIDRLAPALEALNQHLPHIPISVDTYRAKVAEASLDLGASIINDISGGDFDPEMFPLIIRRNTVYILMHLKGSFSTMHTESDYVNFLPEVFDGLLKKANYLRQNGVKDVILDPGFGFSKTLEQNYELLKNLDLLVNEHFPILAGMSRKSMIYKLLDISPEETLPYSVYLHAIAAQKGAKILRVHDIKEYRDILKIQALLQ